MPLKIENKLSAINAPTQTASIGAIQRPVERKAAALTYKPDLRDNPGNDFGLSFDRPEKPQPSVYAAKKNVVDTMEENRPEYTIAEMIVDGLMHKALGVTPYQYGMSQYEKDIQKRKQGVNLELQKAHKAIMPTLLRIADVNSSEYANLEPLQKAMNKNPTLFGKIKNPKKVGVVPEYNPNTGEPNEFAGVPLYSLSYTDPNTGQTEQIKEISVPELLEAYHANLPIPDAIQLERAAARKRVEEKLKKQYKEKGIVGIDQVGTLKTSGQPMFKFRTKGGEIFYGPGVMENGELIRTPFDQINFTTSLDTAKYKLNERKQKLAEAKFKRQGAITTPKQKADWNEKTFELAQELAGPDMNGDPNPVTDLHILRAAAILLGGKVFRGKPGTKDEGQTFIVVDGQPVNIYGQPIEASVVQKPKGGLQTPKKTRQKPKVGLQKLPKKSPQLKPKKKTYPKTLLIDPEAPVIDTESFKKAGKILYTLGKKTGDLHGKGEKFIFEQKQKVRNAIAGLVKKGAKKLIEDQKAMRKQSFGY